MSKRLRAYLDKIDAKPLDKKIVDEFDKEMRERTIPEIIRRERKSAALAAEMRFRPRRRREFGDNSSQKGNEED